MNRRMGVRAVAGALLAAIASTGGAATQRRPHRIGTLLLEGDADRLRQALRQLGYDEPHNIEFIARPLGGPEGIDASARALVAAQVDAIVAGASAATQAAKRATSTIPIVMFYGLAPVELGLIDSLARPGGNVTGTTAAPLEIASKAIDLLRECVARLRTLAVLSDADPWGTIYLRETERAARALGVAFTPLRVDAPADLDRAFAELVRHPPDGIAVGIGLLQHYPQIIEFATAHRLPAIYAVIPAVGAMGGLMAYSTNYTVLMARTASIVDQVLRGTKPASIPVEQPTHYVLAINQKAAKSIGLAIPGSVLLRADIVVE